MVPGRQKGETSQQSGTDWERLRTMTDADVQRGIDSDPDSSPALSGEEIKARYKPAPACITRCAAALFLASSGMRQEPGWTGGVDMYSERKQGTAMLPADKNLHAALSPALLARVEQALAAEQVSLDAFVADAIERRLNRRELDEVLAFGRRHARARGLRPGDVDRAISDVRARGKERGR